MSGLFDAMQSGDPDWARKYVSGLAGDKTPTPKSSALLVPGDPGFADAKKISAKRPNRQQTDERNQEIADRRAEEFLRAQKKAREKLAAERRPADADAKAKLRESFMTSEQLDDVPDLEPLIDGWIFKASLAQIYGPSGHYKTFVAADMARAVCTGTPWFGHESKQGRVLYVVAEGVRGFRKRIRAMEAARSIGRLSALTVVSRAVQIGGPEWPEFIEVVAEDGYDMVIVDTQARTTVGRKENDNTDMGEVVAALDWLIEATSVGVLLIHHSGKDGAEDGRGASAIKGALQSQIRVTRRKGLTVEVLAKKQKDHEELGPYYLQLIEHGDSLVVTADRVVDGMSPDRRDEGEEEARRMGHSLDANDVVALSCRKAIAKVLAAVYGGGFGATKPQLKAAYDGFLVEAGAEKSKAQTFDSAWTKLTKDGHLDKNPRADRFVLNRDGCKTYGAEFELPAWADSDEDEEGFADGDPADELRATLGVGDDIEVP